MTILTIVLSIIGFCLILEIPFIKNHLKEKTKNQNDKILDNIKKHETRTGGLHSDYKYGEKKNERQ